MKSDVILYQAFGLMISSELNLLPPLPMAKNQHARPDVNIAIGPAAKKGLQNPAINKGWYQASPMHFWMHVEDVASFKVIDGNSIVIAPKEEADEEIIRLFLLGSCMGVILHQRKMLVIHGNAIRFDNQCVIFAGPSGAGKSTLAAAFHQRGHDILADDVCAIDTEGCVVPSFPQLKLWQDATSKLQINTAGLKEIHAQAEKFAYPIKCPLQAALPVAAVYILTSNNRDAFDMKSIEGMNKFIALAENTYRMEYLDGLGLKADHLQQCSKLAAKVHLACISRPERGFELTKLMNFILADLQDKGIAVER